MPKLFAPAAHDVHQDRLLARADRVADSAEAAVHAVWASLLEVIERGIDRGGSYWLTTFTAARAALARLPAVAYGVTKELIQTARDSAQWTAENVAANLPAAHREEIVRRKRGVLEAHGSDPQIDLVAGLILPALEEHQILSVVYQAGWVSRIQALTALAAPDALAGQIAGGVQQGLTIQQIAMAIRPTVQGVQTSARRVARTAGLWVAHEAELATYGELGDMISGYRINAVLDSATRPEHRKRDGTVYHCVPRAGQKGVSEMPRPPREADGSWAFNCLLPETVVQGSFTLALKSRYAGKAIEIRTRAGRTLRVTPNHPVCTTAGFLPAGQIREGNPLIGYRGEVGGRLVMGMLEEQQPPTRIDQVFRAAKQLLPATVERGSAFDLHGDAAFGDGEIEVIALGGELRNHVEAMSGQQTTELGFVLPDVGMGYLPRSGPALLDLQGIDLSTSGLLCRDGLGGPGGGIHARPLQPLRIGPAADLDACRHEYPVEPSRGLAGVTRVAPTDAEFVRELLERFPGLVAADHVVEVREYDWSGHVYDLQSVGGWIIANDLLVSNCRCYLSPVLSTT